MTLTLSDGPLSGSPPATVNYALEGPAHKLLFTPFPRRLRATLGGETVFDTRRAMLLHETGILPVVYVPEADVTAELEATERSTHCPFKGEASYATVRAGGRVAENALWTYRAPLEQAAWLEGYVAFYWDRLDAWFDEEEPIRGHVRDPYHRVDVRATAAHVRVLAGDTVIADSHEAKVLSETGMPNRFYLPARDVRDDALQPSDTATHCPYKGDAGYATVAVDGVRAPDGAWRYDEPFEDAVKVRGHWCFSGEELTVEVDGRRAA